MFHPKGGVVRRVMEDYSRRRHEEAGYEFVNTPHITKSALFEKSGHLDWYAEGMYPPMQLDAEVDADGTVRRQGFDYYLKPMNCPMHNLIFDARGRSYRELPLRLFEFGTVYRYEKSGVVQGMTRARGFTQDDAHIYCTREQMRDELASLLDFVLVLLRDYGLDDFYLELSTKDPEKYVGDDASWEEATRTLEEVATESGLELCPQAGVEGRVQIVEAARFGVISDLDDTVIQSDVTSLPRMLVTSLTGNARTRSPFPGVGALYRALTREGAERNPIFYVSSSPWNFFDLLWQFLSYRQIPLGPMFLRNWGFDLLAGHGDYKHGVIERIFARFPEMKFVLVGDSGEHDPQIYAEVVQRHPGRVLAVYIRDVSDAATDHAVLKLREEVKKAGVELVLAADSLYAASHAMAMGLITPEQMRRVQRSVGRQYGW